MSDAAWSTDDLMYRAWADKPGGIKFSIAPPASIDPDLVISKNMKTVLRISQRGVTVPDGVAVDEAAGGVIEALNDHINQLFASKDAEIARLRAKLAVQETE